MSELTEEEAVQIANEELHALRRERRSAAWYFVKSATFRCFDLPSSRGSHVGLERDQARNEQCRADREQGD
jgi:hypothetical protein